MPNAFQNQVNKQSQQQFKRFQQQNRQRAAKQMKDMQDRSRAAAKFSAAQQPAPDGSGGDASTQRGRRKWWSVLAGR